MSRILPILFNTDIVRAILDNKKTATRRPIKQKIKPNQGIYKNAKGQFKLYNITPRCGISQGIILKPPYQPGDILYVRETWQFTPCIECNIECEKCGKEPITYEDKESISEGCFIYNADYPQPKRIVWRPSIHMPKAAARIWLEVTDVRVEQLKDITEQQAEKEGYADDIEYGLGDTAAGHFIEDFKNIYPKCTEDSWIWVIEFKQCEPLKTLE